jgi:hypothetical protein
VPLPFAGLHPRADRRAQATSGAPRVNCRVCGTSVVVDARKLEDGPHYATVPCTGCSALVPVHRTDLLQLTQAQVREQLERAPLGRRTLFDRWRRTH